MKRYLLLAVLALASVASAQEVIETQTVVLTSGSSTTTVHPERYNSAGISHTIEMVWSSVPTSPSVAVKGCMRGGTCSTLATITTTTNSLVYTFGVFDNLQFTTSWTGGMTLTLNITGHVNSVAPPNAQTSTTPAATPVTAAIMAGFNDGQAEGSAGIIVGPTGSAPLEVVPLVFNGATWDKQFYCNKTTFQSAVTATTTQLVGLVAAQKIRVCSAVFVENTIAAASAKFVEGTGANCATGQTSLTGTLASWTATATNDVVALAFENGGAIITNTAADALCVTGTGGAFDVTITYEQH